MSYSIECAVFFYPGETIKSVQCTWPMGTEKLQCILVLKKMLCVHVCCISFDRFCGILTVVNFGPSHWLPLPLSHCLFWPVAVVPLSPSPNHLHDNGNLLIPLPTQCHFEPTAIVPRFALAQSPLSRNQLAYSLCPDSVCC